MPTYEYSCTECGHRFEVSQAISDEPLSVCGVCGGTLRKLFHPVGIAFKGSGFYSTDNKKGAKPAGKGTGTKEGGAKEGGAKEGGAKKPDASGDAKGSGSSGGARGPKATDATSTAKEKSA